MFSLSLHGHVLGRRIRDRLPHSPITIVADDLRFENADMESGGLLHGVSCVVRPGNE